GDEPQPGAGSGEKRPEVVLRLRESERGQFSLEGGLTLTTEGPDGQSRMASFEGLAAGESATVRRTRNAEANASLARDPALQRRVTVMPKASCAGAQR